MTATAQTMHPPTEHDAGPSAGPIGPRKLYRSTRDSKLGGVCGGIAESMGWDPTTVRLLAVLSLLLPGPQLLAYIVAWVILPTDEQAFGWATEYPAPAMPTPPRADQTY